MRQFYACGTSVKLKNCNYEGCITGINIRDSYAAYLISYWANGSYVESTFASYEFDVTKKVEKINLGFRED
jgi:hypothetical protein